MKVKIIFAWYDFWIGLFWDSKKKWLYLFLIPTIGIIFQFNKKSIINPNDPKYAWNWKQ